MQFFLTESTWDAEAINARRLELAATDPRTCPHDDGVLVVDAALEAGFSFRAVVSDCIYGENPTFEAALWAADLPFVLGLKPSTGLWAPLDDPHTPEEAAKRLRWVNVDQPGD